MVLSISCGGKIRVFPEGKEENCYEWRFNLCEILTFAAQSSGCSTVGSVPVWGAGGRVFESRQPDFKSGSSGFFYLLGFLCFHLR